MQRTSEALYVLAGLAVISFVRTVALLLALQFAQYGEDFITGFRALGTVVGIAQLAILIWYASSLRQGPSRQYAFGTVIADGLMLVLGWSLLLFIKSTALGSLSTYELLLWAMRILSAVYAATLALSVHYATKAASRPMSAGYFAAYLAAMGMNLALDLLASVTAESSFMTSTVLRSYSIVVWLSHGASFAAFLTMVLVAAARVRSPDQRAANF